MMFQNVKEERLFSNFPIIIWNLSKKDLENVLE